jgi:hypothetical protein
MSESELSSLLLKLAKQLEELADRSRRSLTRRQLNRSGHWSGLVEKAINKIECSLKET